MRGDGWNDGPLFAGLGATPDAEYQAYYSTPARNVNLWVGVSGLRMERARRSAPTSPCTVPRESYSAPGPRRARNLVFVALESEGPAGRPIRKTAGGLRLKVAGAAVVVASAGRYIARYTLCPAPRGAKASNNGSIPTRPSGATRASCSTDHNSHCCYCRSRRNP